MNCLLIFVNTSGNVSLLYLALATTDYLFEPPRTYVHPNLLFSATLVFPSDHAKSKGREGGLI